MRGNRPNPRAWREGVGLRGPRLARLSGLSRFGREHDAESGQSQMTIRTLMQVAFDALGATPGILFGCVPRLGGSDRLIGGGCGAAAVLMTFTPRPQRTRLSGETG